MPRLETQRAAPASATSLGTAAPATNEAVGELNDESAPIRKAAILLVSVGTTVGFAVDWRNFDRSAVEAVTLEIARLERIAPAEQQAVLEEFYGLVCEDSALCSKTWSRWTIETSREAYHDEDLATWALALASAARPVRQGPSSVVGLRGRRAQSGLGSVGPIPARRCRSRPDGRCRAASASP